MKSIRIMAILGLLFVSCEKQNLCKDGYKPHESNGTTFCIPDYVGKNFDPKLGNTFYHDKYGVIVFSNGVWKDANNQLIENTDR